ncbi:unnamed protein product [Clonostachys rosea f. rosea IK726]|uniref:Uncharacterized protein n=2 Tax=Bionectria ochroleuca TaxID=29856 RepID=A0A0B7JX28_BIOOC|nr:unnamed protein product [Clonostachys rosea f. rosea IK726]
MDFARDFPQIGQENSRVHSSPDLDELFHSYFDWQAYLNDTEPSPRASPQSLNKLITEISPLIDSIETHRFFRMKTSFGPDEEAVTASDYSGHPSPPELVQGEGSTSPSDHSGPILPDRIEEAYHRPGASLKEFRAQDDKWTYPQTEHPQPALVAYSPNLRVAEDATVRQAGHSLGLKRRRSDQAPEKRPRQLARPEQVADVRKSGACLPCRVSKTRCHEHGVCPTCRKAFPKHSHLVCTRMNLAEAWPVISKIPDVWSKNPGKEEHFTVSPHLFTGKPRDIQIFFSRDHYSPMLPASVQAYRWSNEKEDGRPEKAAFARHAMPTHEDLVWWVENQVVYENTPGFPHSVHRFLIAYSRGGAGLPMHGLVTRVNKMACFFRIWKSSSFLCRDPSGKIANLPLSVQAELRTIARNALHRIEHDILKDLDECLTPSRSPKPDDKLALWAALWQLLFMYRELTWSVTTMMARHGQGLADPQNPHRSPIENFFGVLAIFYHYHFRNKKSLEVSLDWLKAPGYPAHLCQAKQALGPLTKAMLGDRKPFLQKLQTSELPVDQLLCVFVVNHELKKLNTRSRAIKSSQSKAATLLDDCDAE